GAAQILFSVGFELAPGEVVALMGRNGAGKTTTLESIMGLVARRTGSIVFRGHELARLPPYEIARLGLGFVPEDRRIFTDLTVLENLEVGRRQPIRSGETASVTWSPERLFELFPNLAEARNRSAGRMSGGEQQMLTIARTLMGNPLAILLDEPSEGIAPIIVDQMIGMIAELKRTGVAILVSEQNLPFAAAVADRAYVLEHGQIKFTGDIRSLIQNEEARRAYLEL
ncbi:MAG: ABC transporter ATP-binding protein, partial [Hyphomicrobiales bacterium]|nr:ABC transporter ATP-binding protein [Hyphomicrobiales bacterium]